ncbi:hypothetical protein KL86DYS1_10001 [uncultured Dysgonomonas sp.]|uniref:Uncharacterized protein n=1 Tax=uncultured Dysgonomonas sp. TaxID=206096 RepID=A0A212ISX9_9BACT|nr:hypothetical protein KL86DYS1_10001 [uncultured Dysgonomonas sp.]
MFKPFCAEFLFQEFVDFLFGQITPVYFLDLDFIACKRVALYQSVISGNKNYAFEKLHELRHRVMAAFCSTQQIHLEVVNKHIINGLQSNIRKPILGLDEISKMLPGDFVFLISGSRFGDTDQSLYIIIMPVE